MTNSREKGKRGELELAAWLRDRGIEARRGRQYAADPEAPDIVHALPGIWLECKRAERCRPYEWLEEADLHASGGTVSVVAHRQSRRNWIAILNLDDLLQLIER